MTQLAPINPPDPKSELSPREFCIRVGAGFRRKNLWSRMGGLGLLRPCGRCLGSGRFSYNSLHGDTCYGCNGGCEVLPKLTDRLAEQVRIMVEQGQLDGYMARLWADAAAKAAPKAPPAPAAPYIKLFQDS